MNHHQTQGPPLSPFGCGREVAQVSASAYVIKDFRTQSSGLGYFSPLAAEACSHLPQPLLSRMPCTPALILANNSLLRVNTSTATPCPKRALSPPIPHVIASNEVNLTLLLSALPAVHGPLRVQ